LLRFRLERPLQAVREDAMWKELIGLGLICVAVFLAPLMAVAA
jgi:hypothetical protein